MMKKILVTVGILCLTFSAQVFPQVAQPPSPPDTPVAAPKQKGTDIIRIGANAFKIDVSKIPPGTVAKSYVLAPGDKLVLKVWGQLQLTYTIKVTDDLYIEIPDVPGRIYVSGLSLDEVEGRVLLQMATVYASYFNLEQPSASAAHVDLTLAEVHDIRFLVEGEVPNPGSYSLHPSLSNIIYAIASAGGITESGSLRNIMIRRGRQIIDFDFYQLLIRASHSPKQVQIQSNDVIFVPLRRSEVTIQGEVRRPGIYELRDPSTENLDVLIELAGGFKPTASLEKLLIHRTTINEGQKTLDIDLLETRRLGSKILLQDQDVITVFATNQIRLDYVSVRGSGMTLTGEFELRTGMRVKDLIDQAGGLRRDAYLGRADLVRTSPDMTKTYLHIPLPRVLEDEEGVNLQLQPLDELVVYSASEIVGGQKHLTLKGHVKHPGKYEFYRGIRLYDLVFAHGGFQDRDYLSDTYLERGDVIRSVEGGVSKKLITFDLGKLLDGDTTQNLSLQSDDEIVIYSVEDILGGDRHVTLSGFVKKPGKHRLFKGMKLLDLLYIAGGFQDMDFRRQAFFPRGDLYRPINRENRLEKEIIRFNLGAVLEGDETENIELESGDEVRVYAASSFQEPRFVTIEGLVNKPGRYELISNMNLSDLLVQAGGLTEAAFQTRAEVARLHVEGSSEVKQQLFIVEITKDYFDQDASDQDASNNHDSNNDESNDDGRNAFRLQNEDIVFVRRKPGIRTPQIIEVQGEVNFPGKYPLTNESRTIADAIELAGGLRQESAFLLGASLTRAGIGRIFLSFEKALSQPDSPDNLVLQHGDSIVIPKKSNVVKVTGEVIQPVVVPYKEGKGVGYYIKQAGGTTKTANRSKTQIIHPNGRITLAKGFLFFGKVKILPGSTITVPPKKSRSPRVAPAKAAPSSSSKTTNPSSPSSGKTSERPPKTGQDLPKILPKEPSKNNFAELALRFAAEGHLRSGRNC